MLNRTVLIVIGILSFFWIVYASITLVSSAQSPRPSSIFSSIDKQVVIIHKPSEIKYDLPEFEFIQSTPFYQQLLSKTERIQHYYFSTSRSIVILERSKPWTIELIASYFEKLGLSCIIKSAKTFTVSNGWKGRYHDHFLLVSEQEVENTETPSTISWNYVDRKASATFLQMEEDSRSIENCYFIGDKTVRYLSKSSLNQYPLVDDQDLFQDIVPSNFDSYRFIEHQYLKSISNPSPVFEWLNQGLVVLEVNGETCLVTDFLSGQNPFAILAGFNNQSNEVEAKTNRQTIEGVALPMNQFANKSWVIEQFNNRIFIAEKASTINAIIGAYETGSTLSQSSLKRISLFEASPKKVSERIINATEHKTVSCLNQSMHIVVVPISSSETIDETIADDLAPIRLNAAALHLLPIQETNHIYVVTADQSVAYISNDRIQWNQTFEESIIGIPCLSGNNLYFSTKNKLHCLQNNGDEAPGFPVEMNAIQCGPVMYLNKGIVSIALIANGRIETIANSGKRLQSCSIGTSEVGDFSIAIEQKKKEQIAHVIHDGNWSSYQLGRNKRILSLNIGEGDWSLVNNNSIVSALGLSNSKFVRTTSNGKSTVLIGNVQNILRKSVIENNELFFLNQQQRIYVVAANGEVKAQFETRVRGIEDAYLLRSNSGKTSVGILDGISNNSYIYTLNGNSIGKRQFEGSGKLVLQRQGDGTVVLISQSNNYLVRYPLNY